MTDINQAPEVNWDPRKKIEIPGTLNVLTILTFIGSGLGLISNIWSFIMAKNSYDKMLEMEASGDVEKMPGFMKKFVGPEALEMTRIAYENKLPILIVSLIGIGLCVYGAIEMRKLKKQGFYVYLMGQILPMIGAVIFMGAAVFSGLGAFGLIFPVLFIILYATQLKYLK
jgi:hypothetical protein